MVTVRRPTLRASTLPSLISSKRRVRETAPPVNFTAVSTARANGREFDTAEARLALGEKREESSIVNPMERQPVWLDELFGRGSPLCRRTWRDAIGFTGT